MLFFLCSSSASPETKRHGTYRGREALSVQYAREVLKMEHLFRADIAKDYFGSLAELSNQVKCWDWKVTTPEGERGSIESDAWHLWNVKGR